MPPALATPPTKVFISYSRKDLAFVDRLDAALRARGIEPLIDRAEIYAFEDWWRRIQDLITKADTIVFVLSQDAVASDICRREVEYAEGLNKRFAPVVARAIDPALAPEALSRLNFIHLDDSHGFESGVDRLVEALSTDIDWVRRHTEFGELARRWAEAGRPGPHGLLLRPPMLEEAESWIASRPANAPLPTEETQSIIAVSRRAETRKRNLVTSALALGLAVALILGALAFWQRQIARENERAAIAAQEAETSARRAEAEQRGLAEAREREAVEAGDRTLAAQSRFLGDASAQALAAKDAGTAVLLALEGLPDAKDGRRRPLLPEARQALDRALAALAERNVALRHAGFALAFGPDGRRIASSGAGEIVVADVATSGIVFREQIGRGDAVSLELAADGTRLLRCSPDEVLLIRLGGPERHRLDLTGDRSGIGPLVSCRLSAAGEGALLVDRNGRGASWSGKGGETAVPLGLPEGLAIREIGYGAGDVLASAPDGEVQLREARSGTPRASLAGRGKPVDAIRISRDGRTVLIRDEDGLRIWDVASATARAIAAPSRAMVELSPDGRRLLLHERWPMNSRGGGFELWDTQGGGRLARLDDSARLVALSFGADGHRIAGTALDGSVRVFHGDDGREVTKLQGHQGRPLAVAMSPDGRFLLSSGFDTRLVLWDLAASRPSRIIEVGRGPVTALAPLPGGREALMAAGGRLQIRDVSGSDSGSGDIVDLGGEVASVALAAGGRRALALLRDGDAVLVDLEGRRQIARAPDAVRHDLGGRLAPQRVSPDGTRFVTIDGGVAIHDAVSGARIARHTPPLVAPVAAAFVTDERLLVWSEEGEAVLLDPHTGAVRTSIRNIPLGLDGRPIEPGRGPARLGWEVVQPSPDGTRLATADALQPRIWDLSTGRLLGILQDHAITGRAGRLRFSPDGAVLFTTERDRIVTAWDVASGARLRSFTGHTGPITLLRVSADGRHLLTGSEDRSARLWDIASGVEIAAFAGHAGPVREALFWPDGRRIGTVSDDGTLRLWPFAGDVQEDVDIAKDRIGRCLTQSQRRRYFLDAEPPAWCFTGPGLEEESDPAKWSPRAPYHMPLWRSWYRQKQTGRPVALPRTD